MTPFKRPPTLIVVPARYNSSRFPGKALANLRGATGVAKPLVERSWEAACRAAGREDHVLVATDDERIMTVARAFGANCLLTPASCANGTERCAAVVELLGDRFEFVVNLQGDAPLTPSHFVDDIIENLAIKPEVGVTTPVLGCDAETVARLRQDRREGRVGATTAVLDRHHNALYFSKEVLPSASNTQVLLHVGLYAYHRDTLRAYAGWRAGLLEEAEGLEQLRFLENGEPVGCVRVDARGASLWEVNNPSDVELVERALAESSLE